MKKLILIITLALAIGSSSLRRDENFIPSVDTAEGGIALFFLYTWSPGYRSWLSDWCGSAVEDTRWQPIKFVFFTTTCVVGFVFGEQNENASIATQWLSADHPVVTEGIKTEGGAFVKFSPEARKFHNDHLDDLVDLFEKARDDIDDYRVKDGGATIDEIANDFHKIITRHVKDIEKSKEFDTPAGREALANFYKLRFNVAEKEVKKFKRK